MHATKPRNLGRTAGACFGVGALLTVTLGFASPSSEPAFVKGLRFVDLGSSLAASADVFGLDRKRDAYVSLGATAELDVVCINPAGKEVPSQKPNAVEVEVEGFAYYPHFAIHFGRLDIDVDTERVAKQIAGAPDCPNQNWTERVDKVEFRDAELRIRQGNKIALELYCVFNPSTTNGTVPNNRVKCFSS